MLKKALLAAACATTLPVFAAYPERPIQIIVPYSPGGGSDLALRLFGETVKKHYPGTNVVVRGVMDKFHAFFETLRSNGQISCSPLYFLLK